MSGDKSSWHGAWLRFRVWARQVKLSRNLGYVLGTAAVASGVATVAAMTGTQKGSADLQTVVALLYLDVMLLLLLAGVVARKLITVWAERRRGRGGAGLHVRFAVLFSAVAVMPAVLVVAFSAIFLNVGIQGWFGERVSTALNASTTVARAYLQEHRNTIRGDALAIAADLNDNAARLAQQPAAIRDLLSYAAQQRTLAEAVVMDGFGRVVARSALSLSLEFDRVPTDAIDAARLGEVVVLTGDQDDRVRALFRLARFVDAYLLVGRFVDSRIIDHIQRVERAVSQYQATQRESRGIQISFVAMFVLVAVLLLLAAVWIGLTLATQMAEPIVKLIDAAERVGEGDLTARVDARGSGDEVARLGRAFNRMTSQIENQRLGLIEANRQIDERRRFTEAVLTGVSAGVIGLDAAGAINLPNRSAADLLGVDLTTKIGSPLRALVPEMIPLLDEAAARPERLVQGQIRFARQGQTRTLHVRVSAERIGGNVIGYVVTFDDITDLLSAQRTAAWADVARRIAHEIKNPLTPIQLSAERLKRKYLKEIATDPDTFATCTETIIRQVEDIGRMVDEFSTFARMPQPSLKPENLSEICRQAIFLERARHPAIDYIPELPPADVPLFCDVRQVSRAIVNVLKNGAEAVEAAREKNGEEYKGWVRLKLTPGDPARGLATVVAVEDNGIGLPADQRDRLTEPYVTTRTKGTGLGLAIVRKIMEDHNGEILLDDREGGGARISLVFRGATAKEKEPAAAVGGRPLARIPAGEAAVSIKST
ncbi:MAG: PAS domain-containing sensor histidine kinase [Acidimicrobiia bacterium]|nr:PAS domain-containing sensor histidine kinase [Acidimicrobiia bacterium]